VATERIYEALEGHLIPGQQEGDKIVRYEAHIHRQDAQAHARLEALQSRRRGKTPAETEASKA
jgi:hypothetical protein